MSVAFLLDDLSGLRIVMNDDGRMTLLSGIGPTLVHHITVSLVERPQPQPQPLPARQFSHSSPSTPVRAKQVRLKKETVIEEADQNCAVCSERMSKTRVVYTGTCTRHFVCGGCMRNMRKHAQDNRCPVCRANGAFRKVSNWKSCVKK